MSLQQLSVWKQNWSQKHTPDDPIQSPCVQQLVYPASTQEPNSNEYMKGINVWRTPRALSIWEEEGKFLPLSCNFSS